MNKVEYPINPEDIAEVSGSDEANKLCKQGYVLLGTRNNKFIVDDGVFEEEFIYSLAKPKEED